MIETLLNVLLAGLKLWDDKEKTKYIDRAIKLKEQYYEEYNKSLADRSDAVLDDIYFQLRVLGAAFASSVGKSNPQA